WGEGCLGAGGARAAGHALGIVHRDFKPENVLIGGDGRARVCDFGLARTLGAADAPRGGASPAAGPLTTSGAIVGTPVYMAPEQWRGREPGARADRFSFAVALRGALLPGLPSDRPGAGGGPAEPPRTPRVPASMQRALARALRADPAARFPTLDALLAELARDPAASRR